MTHTHTHTQSHTHTHMHTLGRTPLEEGSAHRRDAQHTKLTRDRYPCPQRGSNQSILASVWQQTYVLDFGAQGIHKSWYHPPMYFNELLDNALLGRNILQENKHNWIVLYNPCKFRCSMVIW